MSQNNNLWSLTQRHRELPLTGRPWDTLANVQDKFQGYLGLKLSSVTFDIEKDAKNWEIKLSFATKGNFSLKNFTRNLGLNMQLKESSKYYTQL